jgi:hypothetical protein
MNFSSFPSPHLASSLDPQIEFCARSGKRRNLFSRPIFAVI